MTRAVAMVDDGFSPLSWEQVPPIRGRRPDVPERLAAALARMLAKDRAGRFVSAAGVVAALQPLAAGADLAGLSLTPPPRAIVAA